LTGQPAPPGRPSLIRAVVGILAYALLGYSLAQLIAILLFSAATWAGGPVEAWSKDQVTGSIFLVGVALILGFATANIFVGQRVFGLTRRDLRWKETGRPWAGTTVAFALGVVLAFLAMALAAVFGSARWSQDEGDLAAYIGRIGLILLMLAPAALAEELMFRGLPIVVLDRTIGRGAAVGITALAFALTHSGNPEITTLSIGNICIAGLLLGVAFFAPGGIWTATGLHLGWNWGLAAMDAPVSGLALKIPFIDYNPGQPAWLTGGSFGPEGGVLATLVLGGATILVAKRFLGHHTPDMESRPQAGVGQ
jgi:membrane protease YdiL (CAAX protease family)